MADAPLEEWLPKKGTKPSYDEQKALTVETDRRIRVLGEGVGEVTDAGMAAVAESGGEFTAALTAQIDEATGIAVPPLVTAALADDPTVQAAADAAVSDAVVGLDLVEGDDQRIPRVESYDDYAQSWVDENDRVAAAITNQGHFMAPFVDVGEAATVSGDSTSSARHVTADSVGRRAESEIGADGRVPAWVLKEWAARMPATAPRFDGYDVVVAMGQSNAVQADASLATYLDDDRIMKWNGSAIVAMPASDVYLLPQFAREYIKTIPATRKVLIVPTAVGATGFTSTSLNPPPAGYVYYPTTAPNGGTWDRNLTSDPNNYYLAAVSKTLAAMAAAGAGARLVAALWSQGEQDTPTLNESQYAARLDDLIAAFRTAVASSTLPFIIGSLTPEDTDLVRNTYTLDVSQALAATPARVQRTAFCYGPRGYVKPAEVIHYSTAGQIARGPLFLDGLYRARANVTTVAPQPPANLRISRHGDAVTASWTPPLTRAVTYTVEISSNGGSSYSAMTVDALSLLSATATVAAATPVIVRAKTTNEVGTSEPVLARG